MYPHVPATEIRLLEHDLHHIPLSITRYMHSRAEDL